MDVNIESKIETETEADSKASTPLELEDAPPDYAPSSESGPVGPGDSEVVQPRPVPSSLWFDDGTIVIQAENTVFRVYKGLIAQRAAGVFQDLFTAAQPGQESSDMYDGVPIVKMHDSANEMEIFLRALLESPSFDSARPSPSLEEAMVLTRLSSKYYADAMFYWAKRPIERVYGARSLEQFLQVMRQGEAPLVPDSYHIEVINLAQRCNLPELLPVAFYRAARALTVPEVFEGIKLPEGNVVKLENDVDKYNLMEGMLRLLTAYPHISMSAPAATRTNIGCVDATVCGDLAANKKHRALRSALLTLDRKTYLRGLLLGVPWIETVEAEVNEVFSRETWCKHCRLHATKQAQAQQRQMWDSLPGFFNLPKRFSAKKASAESG